MLVDSYILPECIVRPGSFGGLMTLYEANYIKFAAIIPDPAELQGSHVSTVSADCDLHLSVEQQSRYTHDVRLTYWFDDANHGADPDLVARIYLDARMVEVRSWIDVHQHQKLQSLSQEMGNELDQRWIRNMMFSKWLDYLQDKGHQFGAVCT